MRSPSLLALASAALVCVSGCTQEPQTPAVFAERVYTNARIYTLNDEAPWAEAMALDGETISVIGTSADLADLIGPATDVIDLDGRFVMPGIHDAHVHTQMVTEFSHNLTVDPIRPWADIAADIRRYADANPDKTWILGGNLPWLTGVVGGNPDVPAHAETLDALAPDHAVALWDIGGHAMLANSRALKLAGIDASTPDPVGGTIERNAEGQPTGVLRELAANLVTERADALSLEAYEQGLREAVGHLNSLGITSFNEAWSYPATAQAFKALDATGRLNARVTLALAHPVEFVTAAAKQQARSLIDDWQSLNGERLQARYVKFVLDGSAGGQTLALIDPYEGTDFRGKLRNPEAEVMREVSRLHGEGIGSLLHAVGDRAVRIALNAIEEARENNPDLPVRHIVSHTVFVNPEDLDRFKAVDAIVEFSPYFWQPTEGADILRDELGLHRLGWAFPMRRIVDDGNRVAAGSDWPVVFDPNPFPAIEAMVTRERSGGSDDSFGAEHAITLPEALEIMTRGGAYAHHMEAESGALKPGMLADFIVLDQNLLEIPVRQVHRTRVLRTVLSGVTVYSAEGEDS